MERRVPNCQPFGNAPYSTSDADSQPCPGEEKIASLLGADRLHCCASHDARKGGDGVLLHVM